MGLEKDLYQSLNLKELHDKFICQESFTQLRVYYLHLKDGQTFNQLKAETSPISMIETYMVFVLNYLVVSVYLFIITCKRTVWTSSTFLEQLYWETAELMHAFKKLRTWKDMYCSIATIKQKAIWAANCMTAQLGTISNLWHFLQIVCY